MRKSKTDLWLSPASCTSCMLLHPFCSPLILIALAGWKFWMSIICGQYVVQLHIENFWFTLMSCSLAAQLLLSILLSVLLPVHQYINGIIDSLSCGFYNYMMTHLGVGIVRNSQTGVSGLLEYYPVSEMLKPVGCNLSFGCQVLAQDVAVHFSKCQNFDGLSYEAVRGRSMCLQKKFSKTR